MKMRKIMKIFIFWATIALALFDANATVLSTNFDSGFKIFKTGHVSGAGTNATAALNKDNNYDFWGEYCGKSKDYLCFPNPELVFLTIPQNVKYIQLNYYTDDGYGNNAAKMTSGNVIYSSDFHSFATYVTRPLRLQVYDDIRMNSSDCSGTIPGKTLPPLNYETSQGALRVYDLISEKRWSTCEVVLQNYNNQNSTKISVSLGAIQFRYDNNIFGKVPSGNYPLTYERADKITYYFYDENNKQIASGMLFNKTKYNMNINVEAFLDFELITPRSMKMFFQPQNKGRQFFHIKTLLTSNLPFINATVQCQYTDNGECALSDGINKLPLLMGVRSDHRTANNYSLEMKHNKPTNLTSELGTTLYKLNKLTFMFGLDSEVVNNIPQSYGKTFSGNVTIIIEGGFD